MANPETDVDVATAQSESQVSSGDQQDANADAPAQAQADAELNASKDKDQLNSEPGSTKPITTPAALVELPEPLLKYERIGGHFHAIFKDDSLSCIALHVNFMCVGTYGGHVLLLELDGKFIRRLHQHYKKVNAVCIDESGQYIASCSDDGTVAIYTLFPASSNAAAAATATGGTSTAPPTKPGARPPSPPNLFSTNGDNHKDKNLKVATTGGEVNIYNYFSAVYTVQLEDRYALKRERSFACGGIAGQFIINKKGWIIDKEQTVHEGEGPVHAIRWRNGLVAWANDWGVKVYDADQDQRITYIERPPNCPPMELCRCHLEWQSNSILLVGWAHTLRVVSFKKATEADRTGSNASSSDILPGSLMAEVVALITFDFFVAGLSPWGADAVCVLAFRPPGSAPNPVARSTAKDAAGTRGSKRIQGEGTDTLEMPFPELHVVGFDGKQVAADILNLKGYYRLRASDYKMPNLLFAPMQNDTKMQDYCARQDQQQQQQQQYESVGIGRLVYICTPKDVILCRLRDVDDRVTWALAHKQYSRALEVAMRDVQGLRNHKFETVLEFYLSELIKKKLFTKAAQEIHRLFVGESFGSLWEKYVYVFAQKGQLAAIAKYLPTNCPRLPNVQYEMVLKHFLDSDPEQLLELIRKWPKPRQQVDRQQSFSTSIASVASMSSKKQAAPEYTETEATMRLLFEPLYDPIAWINQLEAVVRRRRIAEAESDQISLETSYLMEALAELYSATEQYEHALRIYLSQGTFCTNKAHAFRLIGEHQLWHLVHHKIPNLLQIDPTTAIQMLVTQTDQFPIVDVVKQLDDPHHRESLFEYLHQLVLHKLSEYNSEVYSWLHERQVALYAEFQPGFLLKFLQMSHFLPLENAFHFCSAQQPPLWEAMIYILGRMGQHKRALDLILTQMQDINQAIRFVQENDETLWEYLIDLSLTSQANVEELLKCATLHKIDPIKLIKKIPEDMEIDHLKQKLLEIFANFRIQQNLCEGCTKVFKDDRVQLLQRQVAAHKKARRVIPKRQCCLCLEILKAPAPNGANANVLVGVGVGMNGAAATNRICVFECGHAYHLVCLEEKTRMWKRTSRDVSTGTLDTGTHSGLGGLEAMLGCFVCDHSSRTFARPSDSHLEATTPSLYSPPMRGISETRLQQAKDAMTMTTTGGGGGGGGL